MDKIEFTRIMKYLATAYNKDFDKDLVGLWYDLFKDDDINLFKIAIKNIIKKQTYMPAIAEVKKEMANMQVKDIPKAEDEWNEVLKNVREYGTYRVQEGISKLKPYTAYIVSHIGYINICMAEDQTWNKKEFIEEYNLLKDKEVENIQIGDNARMFLNNLKMIGDVDD